MKYIAHRGNLNGPNVDLENRPDYLLAAIENGYDVEIDVWVINNQIFFGHDKPQYDVTDGQITLFSKWGWFHCKNVEALQYFIQHHPQANFFFHQADDAVLTSRGFIWGYPIKSAGQEYVAVMPEIYGNDFGNPYAVCTDYIKK